VAGATMVMSAATIAALTTPYLPCTCTLTGPGAATSYDEYEVPTPGPDEAPQTGIRCFAGQPLGQGELITAGESIVTHEWHVLIPAGVAVTEAHRVTDVRDDAGAVLTPGPLNVREVRRLVGHTTLICAAVSSGAEGR